MTQSGWRAEARRDCARGVLGHDGAVRLHDIDHGAAAGQFDGNEVARDRRARQQHALARRGRERAKAASRPSATYSLPIRSTFRCSASTAARVAGPMAQMLRAQRAQIGGERSSRSMKKRTPFALVKISQSYDASSAMARSSGA